jgi:prepilin-type processing-associated H-X9-DG protein
VWSSVPLPNKPGNYLMISGAGETVDGIRGNATNARGVFYTNSWLRLATIRDGTSNTVAFSESLRGPGSPGSYEVPAGTSNDVTRYLNNAGDPFTGSCDAPVAQSAIRMGAWYAGNLEDGNMGNTALPPNTKVMDCTFHSSAAPWKSARSEHPGGVNAAFVDGHVAFIKDSISPATWQALGTRAGSEPISADSY